VRRNREKSDFYLQITDIQKEIRIIQNSIKILENLTKAIPTIVEDAYIQNLLTLDKEQKNTSGILKVSSPEVVKYREKSYSRVELIRLRSQLLNDSWNVIAIQNSSQNTENLASIKTMDPEKSLDSLPAERVKTCNPLFTNAKLARRKLPYREASNFSIHTEYGQKMNLAKKHKVTNSVTREINKSSLF